MQPVRKLHLSLIPKSEAILGHGQKRKVLAEPTTEHEKIGKEQNRSGGVGNQTCGATTDLALHTRYSDELNNLC